ncbi:response regulator [Cohnella thailandensis]|uniref:Circadian input-output histidine kinase CikA n=1 Tax=Cohnella thailandensis TaxID=557557 RepID=A0A841T6E9_9BACL|nr:response regulator [Cohnella thailandensis]MBB6637878.1 response regulator [Cohnella thailandensis]MBP1977414.1 signal transduction histidine kinase/CHASE3 domain sensor protein [Cohnella thailandensis]
MRIKTKLIIGFIILMVLLVGITSFGYDRMSRMNDRMNSFNDSRFEMVKEVIDLRGTVNQTGRAVSDVLLNVLESDRLSVDDLKLAESVFEAKLASMVSRARDPQERQAVDQVSRDLERYSDFLNRFAALIERGDKQAALELYKSLGRTRQDNAVSSLNSLTSFEQMTIEEETNASRGMYNDAVRWFAVLTMIGLFIGLGVMLWVLPTITKGFNLLTVMAKKFSQGRLRGLSRLEIESGDEIGQLAKVFKQIAADLQEKNEREALYAESKEQQAWIDAQMAKSTELIHGGGGLANVAQTFANEFTSVLGAAYSVVYFIETDEDDATQRLAKYGSYAHSEQASGSEEASTFAIGEGLVGQCALKDELLVIEPLPSGYVPVRSGLGEAEPLQLVLAPIEADGTIVGVLELAYLRPIGNLERELLERLTEKFAYIVMNLQSRYRVEELLREAQAMTEELQVQSEELISQQEELRDSNERLEVHAGRLKKSEERLQRQQEELENANQELMAKTMELEEQIRQTARRNREVAAANLELERQTAELARASQYKSEFLANMSHELRTPLNSLIILSQFLEDNAEGNLTDKQLEFVKTIHSSGEDLLKMIDEILDLAKVDAGRMDIQIELTPMEDITVDLEHAYRSIAEDKGLSFSIGVGEDVPAAFPTDGHRLKQILRNLLSNAMKFTLEGSVSLTVRRGSEEELEGRTERYLAFEVKDTGIGIAEEKREIIFEAFRQADGTTSRKFGGTGLGLTISRDLSQLLGGWITLRSEVGRGSAFTLYLPVRGPDAAADAKPRISWMDGGLLASAAEETETLPALESEANREYGLLKEPVMEKETARSAYEGKTVLLVDDDPRNVFSLTSLLNHHRMNVYSAENGREALELLESGIRVDLVLMDIMMPEMDGYEAIERIRGNTEWSSLPIIALTAKAMKGERDKCLQAGASDYLAKPVSIDQLLSLLKVWLSR